MKHTRICKQHWNTNLLAKVMVDEGSFECKVARRIDGISVVCGRFHRRLVDGQQIKFRIVALVEKQLVTFKFENSLLG